MKITNEMKAILNGKCMNKNSYITVTECKKFGITKKEALETLQKLMSDQYHKQSERRKNKIEFSELNITSRLNNKKSALLEKLIEENYNINTNRGLEIRNSDKYYFRVNSETDWDYYAKSYKYPKHWNTTIMDINLKDFKLYSNYHVVDGIVNTKIISEKTFLDFTLLYVNCLITKQGNKIAEEKKFIAIKDGVAFHDNSINEAIKGVLRKIKRLNTVKEEKIITNDTYITKTMYHKITGACYAGIEDFINKYNLNGRNRIKVSELLEITNGNDFYGKNTLISLLK
jgi:hypothetical protein